MISGAAYRGYLGASAASDVFTRLAAWATTIVTQYTPIGLVLALIGLAEWDRRAPTLRNFGLLWIAPVSVYSILYHTRDSDIYLLPVAWIMALWLAVGSAVVAHWLVAQRPTQARWIAAGWGSLLIVGVPLVAIWRWPCHDIGTRSRGPRLCCRCQAGARTQQHCGDPR
ncbi:MAG: hypothetical protein IPK16_07345 [Anaerolineales bacterium]|nr:hypothetical protein [Anaerolineales bacterium]